MQSVIRIGSRESRLAVKQAEIIKAFGSVYFTTSGDVTKRF